MICNWQFGKSRCLSSIAKGGVPGAIPLAGGCIEAGSRALRHNGEAFTAANIGHQLAMRDLMADLRSATTLH